MNQWMEWSTRCMGHPIFTWIQWTFLGRYYSTGNIPTSGNIRFWHSCNSPWYFDDYRDYRTWQMVGHQDLQCPRYFRLSIYHHTVIKSNCQNVFYQFENWMVTPEGSPIWHNVCLNVQPCGGAWHQGDYQDLFRWNARENVPRFEAGLIGELGVENARFFEAVQHRGERSEWKSSSNLAFHIAKGQQSAPTNDPTVFVFFSNCDAQNTDDVFLMTAGMS